jgi:hypothetical protein
MGPRARFMAAVIVCVLPAASVNVKTKFETVPTATPPSVNTACEPNDESGEMLMLLMIDSRALGAETPRVVQLGDAVTFRKF